MKATVLIVALSISTALIVLSVSISGQENSKVERGIQISPVPLKLTDLDRSMVGWGSYFVNATSGCATCHTCPTYIPGSEKGKNKQINSQNYMAGGVPFALPPEAHGPRRSELKSANLTPDAHGQPGGLTFGEFKAALTEGHRTLTDAYTVNPAPSEAYTGTISVMPWRIYQNLSTDDLAAIFEYLKAIPPAKPGTCTAAGQ